MASAREFARRRKGRRKRRVEDTVARQIRGESKLMDRIGALARLSRLRAEGVLTDAEFEEAKRTWIDNLAPAPNAGIVSGSGSRWIGVAILSVLTVAGVAAGVVLWR